MEAQAKGNFLYDEVLPRSEAISWLVLGLGLLLRGFFLIQKCDILLLIGLGGLATIYFLRAFAPSDMGISVDTTFSSVPFAPLPTEGFISLSARQLVAFGSALIYLGIAFKLLFWQGSTIMLVAGIGMLLPAIAWQSSVGSLVRQTVLIAGLGLIGWAIPTETLIRRLYRDDPALVAKMLYQHQHPNDKAATEEVLRRLAARRKHQPVH